MSILVTGGAGYIGSHTCVELLMHGYDIVVIDNYSNSKPTALDRVMELTGRRFKCYAMDLLDIENVYKVFHANEIEAVIHFAGFKAVGESVRQPLKYYHNNMLGTVGLCRIMQEFDVKKLVFSSSATVYGMSDRMPLQEDFPLKATNPYGRTKLMIEEILEDIYKSDHHWSIAALRYFNPVGAHPSARIGEDPNGVPSNLMPYITQVAVGKLEKLHIYGDDYPTPDGTGVRDYIHVVDLAQGHVKAIEKVMKHTGFEPYNLGTGIGYSVIDMLNTFEKATGVQIPYRIVDRRPGDIAACYADPSKAERELGWKARKGIREMCEDAWRWQANNPDGYN
jgi:UDP-glucose 4-epimerase